MEQKGGWRRRGSGWVPHPTGTSGLLLCPGVYLGTVSGTWCKVSTKALRQGSGWSVGRTAKSPGWLEGGGRSGVREDQGLHHASP